MFSSICLIKFDFFFLNLLDSSEIFYTELVNLTNATSLHTIADIVEEMKTVKTDLVYMTDETNKLRAYASQLNDGK